MQRMIVRIASAQTAIGPRKNALNALGFLSKKADVRLRLIGIGIYRVTGL